MFTNEPRFSLTQRDGRHCVWRRCGEQYMPNVVQEGDQFRQGSVMVWGGIGIDGLTDLVVIRGNLTSAGYIEQILLQYVLVAAYGVGPEFVLMHSYSVHQQSRLAKMDIQEKEWPAVSPDLNPIKHVWDRLN